MTPLTKVSWCLLLNAILLMIVVSLVVALRDESSTYFRWGPQQDLVAISVRINTWSRWLCLVILIMLVRAVETVVGEVGGPILGFRIYNPDCKEVKDFTYNQLSFLGNAMWLCSGVRGVFSMMISITQIDLALMGVVFSEIVSFVLVRALLKEKKFITEDPLEEDDVPLVGAEGVGGEPCPKNEITL